MSGKTLTEQGIPVYPPNPCPNQSPRTRSFIFPRLGLVLALAAIHGAAAATVYVDVDHTSGTQDGASWATAFPTIQEGIDAAFAAGGDQVWIAEGTYSESLLMKSGVVLFGGFVGSETALSERDITAYAAIVDGSEADAGGPADHVVTINSVSNTHLDGLTITGGSATTGLSVPGYGTLGAGGGIYCVNADDTNVIARCRIIDNYAGAGGAGIFCDGASPSIVNCEINSNFATNIYAVPTGGGGIGAIDGSSPYVANTVISGNRGNYAGGVLCFDASSPYLHNCVISGNWADTAGGGIGCALDSNPRITNCTISSNSAPVAGGLTCGWEFLGLPYGNSDPIVTNTVFHSNTNYAVYERLTDSDPLVRYCVFYGNPDGDWFDEYATGYTGASTIDTTLPEASNNIDGNPAFTMGATGAWVAAPTYNATTNRTALVAASGSFTSGALVGMMMNPNTAQYRQALVTDNTPTTVYVVGDVTGFAASGNTFRVLDYHLGTSSACLDAGTDGVSISVTIPSNDIDGQPRPFDYPGVDNNGGLPDFDIGADEWSSAAANAAPIANNEAYEVTQGLTLNIAAPGLLANDSDADFDPLTAHLDTDVTHGTLTLNADGSFTYEHDGGASSSDAFTYSAFDGTAYSDAPASVTITIVAGNRTPVLDPIGNKQVDMEQLLQFTVSASDPDPEDTLTYSASNLPSGATFNPATRTFSWTPLDTQDGIYEDIVFTVTDDGSPSLDDSETISITVLGGNNPPVLDPIGDKHVAVGGYLDFGISATDPDLYDWVSYEASNLPPGAQWWPGARRLTWATTADDEGVYQNVLFTATDHGTPPLSDSEAITIVVGDVNSPPVLDPIGDKQVNEGQLLQFTISGSDPDVGDTLAYAASNLPPGATFNATTRTFSWTPAFGDAGSYQDVLFSVTDDGVPQLSDSEGITITVGDVNRPPVLSQIGNRQVDEGSTLTFTVTGYDPDEGDILSFAASNLPPGATFNTATHVFTWTPGFGAAGSYQDVLFTVADAGSPALSDSESITVTVGDVNQPPALNPIGNRQVDEGELLQFTVTAVDPDVGDTLAFSASNLPPGASFNATTQTFSWTPAFGDAGSYQEVLFSVADDGSPVLTDSEAITITVGDVNRPPVLSPIGNRQVNEDVLLQFTITASDPDAGDSLDFSASNLPPGATFNATTRTFSWTPDFGDAGSYQDVLFTVTDDGSPVLSDSESITISVGDVNRPPVLSPIGNRQAEEGQLLEFTITSTDPDAGDTLSFGASNLPPGASFNATTRTFSWTPDFGDAGSYQDVLFTVTDNGSPALNDSESITITVGDVNRPPVLSPIGNRQAEEGQLLEFTITATDPDAGDALAFSASNLPPGASFDVTTRTFSWTPDFGDAGSYQDVLFAVADDGSPALSDSESITVTVGDVNRPPALSPIGNKQVPEGQLLEFVVSASDPDMGQSLAFSAGNLPPGATFNPTTHTFSWTPDFGDAGNYQAVLFAVTDNGSPALSDSESITITVGDVNRPPVLSPIGNKQAEEGQLLEFTVTASDPDVSQSLAFSASNLPPGATFDPTTRTFSWTPDFGQGGTFQAVLFTVTDNGSPALGDSETITVTVGDVNQPPVLSPIGNRQGEEGQLLQFSLTASDPDAGQNLTFGASNLPPGATFDIPTRTFSWTPSFGQAGSYQDILFTVTDNGSPALGDSESVTITVGDVNQPPVLSPVGSKQGEEGQLLEFTVTASDPDVAQTLTLAASNLPSGAAFNAATGVFSWTPDFGEAGSYQDVLFSVTDDGSPALGDSESITITVGDVNRPPVLSPIGNRQVDEGELLQFTVSATDPDAGQTLTFAASNLPSGAAFDPSTRTFSWTPAFGDAGSYQGILFTATDDGSPALSDSETITITVGDVNRPPDLSPVGSKQVDEGQLLQFTVSATDPDAGQTLTFAGSNLPSGATFNPTTHTFSWTPAAGSAGNYLDALFTVTDNGSPALSDSESITITVGDANRPPVLSPIGSKQVTEGELLEFAVTGSDPDADDLTFGATDLPPGATFNPTTQRFSWTPGFDASGDPYGVTFTATDNGSPALSDSETIAITVNEINRAPVLQPIGDKSIAEGDLLAFTVTATDEDDDVLVLDASNLPEGANLVDHGDGTASFSWRPGYQDAKNSPFTITFVVFDTDISPQNDSETVTIEVTNVNSAPVGVDDSYTVLHGGQLNVAAPGVLENDADAEGDPLSGQLVSLPTVGTLAFNGASGAFIFLPGSTTESEVTFTYYANDGEMSSQTPATVTIHIEGPANTAVPDVVGLTESEAQTDITSAGLTVGDTVDAYDASVPFGRVVSQTPPAGTMVSAATSVDLVVSLGSGTPTTFYVDADNTSGVEDGSATHPFSTVTEAINQTEHGRGDTIVVMPGAYAEALTLKMNTTLLAQRGSYHTHVLSAAKISGDLLILAEDCVIRGFSIGYAAGSAVEVSQWTSATMSNCVVHSSGEGLHLATGARMDIMNSTFVSNNFAIKADVGAVVARVKNTIFDSNNVALAADSDALEQAAYNCYFGNAIDLQGPSHASTDLADDPLFVNAAGLNFHLRATSPCRDAGTPWAGVNDLDGSQNDIGADGGPYGVQDTTAPAASIDTDVAEGDAPLTVNFSAAASSDEWGISSYQWDFDAADGVGVDAQGVDAQHTFTQSGIYTVTLTVEDNSGFVSQTTAETTVGVINVTAWVVPMAGQAPLEINFHAEVLGAYVEPVTYAWDIGNNGSVDLGGQNPLRTFATPREANYVVTVTATDDTGNWAQNTVRLAVLAADPVETVLAEPGSDISVSVEDSGTELDGVSVFIPAGALSEPAVVAIAPVPAPPLASPTFFGAPVQVVPGGITFEPPATVTLIHPAETQHPSTIEVRYFDAATGRWSTDGITNVQHMDGAPNHTVTFQTTHFTIFAVTPELRQTDVNLDSSVNAVDVQLVINAALGLPSDYPHSDINEDGNTNAIDVQRVINGALGLE